MAKGFIFDFDGVIIDTERKKFSDLKEILNSYGYSFGEAYFKKMIGKKTGFFLSEIYPSISKQMQIDIRRKKNILKMKNLHKFRLIPGIKSLLRYLKKNKFSVALTTGSENKFVKRLLKYHSLYSYFDVIVPGESFKSSKPNPECYKTTLKKMKLPASEAIIIEDAVAGVEAGKRAGCRVFAVMTYFNKKELSKADMIFKDHKQILSMLMLKKGLDI